jgi:hypothetical protein
MDNKTRDGLITSGVVIGLLGLLYLIFRKKNTPTTIVVSPLDNGKSSYDPYSLTDKSQKIQVIKDYLKANSPDSDVFKNDMEKLGDPYWWNQSDIYARQTDNGVNAWYAAIQKNQPTFTFYRDDFFKNYGVYTKTGQHIDGQY